MESEDSPSEDIDDEVPNTSRPQTENALSVSYLLRKIYYNKFYWEIAKSVVIFAVALKLAHQCRHLVIPMRYYEPFSYINVCTCR